MRVGLCVTACVYICAYVCVIRAETASRETEELREQGVEVGPAADGVTEDMGNTPPPAHHLPQAPEASAQKKKPHKEQTNYTHSKPAQTP